MNIKENLSDFLFTKKYFITLYNDELYINGFQEIDMLTNTKVILNFDDRIISISGENIKPKKILDRELALIGKFADIRITNV